MKRKFRSLPRPQKKTLFFLRPLGLVVLLASAALPIALSPVPVHNFKEFCHKVGPAILIVNVVRVLPNINAEAGGDTRHAEWAGGISVGVDIEAVAAVVVHKEDPPAAEQAEGRIGEALLKASREPYWALRAASRSGGQLEPWGSIDFQKKQWL